MCSLPLAPPGKSVLATPRCKSQGFLRTSPSNPWYLFQETSQCPPVTSPVRCDENGPLETTPGFGLLPTPFPLEDLATSEEHSSKGKKRLNLCKNSKLCGTLTCRIPISFPSSMAALKARAPKTQWKARVYQPLEELEQNWSSFKAPFSETVIIWAFE